jgi:hypothetical protein
MLLPEVDILLETVAAAPGIRAVAIFEEKCRRHPEIGPGVRRTLERRIRPGGPSSPRCEVTVDRLQAILNAAVITVGVAATRRLNGAPTTESAS